MAPTIKVQLQMFIAFLRGSQFPINHPVFGKAMQFVYILKQFPTQFTVKEQRSLREAIQKAFSIADTDIDLALAGVESNEIRGSKPQDTKAAEIEESLWKLIPPDSFLYRYCDYTRNHEAPLAYHVFAAIIGISAIVNNKVWYDMGYYRLFPALNILILGPSGIKKSTAVDVMGDMLVEWQYCNIYTEKFTPEYFQKEIAKDPTGFLFIRELSSVIGKERYTEGTVPLLTRLADHKTFPTGTKGGGKIVIHDPAPAIIMCTTPESITTQVTAAIFGGGFMARFITVYQDVSPRVEPSPGRDKDGNFVVIKKELRTYIQGVLGELVNIRGEMHFTQEAYHRYDSWYRESKPIWLNPEVPLLATYYQRKQDHVKCIAMCIHLVNHGTMSICLGCFNFAVSLLDWTEKFIAPAYKDMFKTSSGTDNDLVLKAIKVAGGVISHSNLVRAVQYRLDSARLRIILQNLTQSGQIEEKTDKVQHSYLLIE